MAAVTQDYTNFAALLKEIFPTRKIEVEGYKNRPFIGMVFKNADGFDGDEKLVPVIFEGHQGASNTFSNAQTNSNSSESLVYKVTTRDIFATPLIDGKLMRASRRGTGVITSAVVTDFESAFNATWNKLASQGWRGQSGSIGRVGSTSTTTLTLLEISDIVNFGIGMTIGSDDVDGGGTVDATTLKITGIDEDAGTLTSATDWDASGFFADNDFLFGDGDYDAAIHGVKEWIPDTAPTGGDSHFGVDRSTTGIRAFGSRFVAVSGTHNIERALRKGAAKLDQRGGVADTVFLNSLDFDELTDELTGRETINRPALDINNRTVAEVGYKGITIHTAAGTLEVFGDRFQKKGSAHIFNMADWELASLGATVGFENEDGPDFLRKNGSNDYEARIVFYGNLVCWRPINQMFVDISPVVSAS